MTRRILALAVSVMLGATTRSAQAQTETSQEPPTPQATAAPAPQQREARARGFWGSAGRERQSERREEKREERRERVEQSTQRARVHSRVNSNDHQRHERTSRNRVVVVRPSVNVRSHSHYSRGVLSCHLTHVHVASCYSAYRYPIWNDPYGGYYSSGYYSSAYGYGRPYRYRETGSLRTLVKPRQTRVYIDGYYAGIVDDFDGIFQRLYIAPGRHEVAFKLEGFREHRVRVYVPYDTTVKIHHDMFHGGGKPTVIDQLDRDYDFDEDRDLGSANERDFEDLADRDLGQIRFEVRPRDASIYVDGRFRGSAEEIRTLSLSDGRHQVEVVRPGFRTAQRDVEVRRGRTVDVDIELDKP